MLVQGYATKVLKSKVGMVALIESLKSCVQNLQVAYAVVPLKITSTSNALVELAAGTLVAEFSPLVKSASSICTDFDHRTSRGEFSCGPVDTLENIREKLHATIDHFLSNVDKEKLEKLLLEFSDVFFSDKLGHVDVVHHKIDTGDDSPIKQCSRRLPNAYSVEASQQVKNMLEQNVIQSSTSAWASLVVLGCKKDRQLRFCVDYQKLNKFTKCEAFPLPNIPDLLRLFKRHRTYTVHIGKFPWMLPNTVFMNFCVSCLVLCLHHLHSNA